jgi:hypothetical protein
MRIVDGSASHQDCHAVPGYHLRRTLASVIPGLTRNPGFIFWIPAFAGMTNLLHKDFMQRLGLPAINASIAARHRVADDSRSASFRVSG